MVTWKEEVGNEKMHSVRFYRGCRDVFFPAADPLYGTGGLIHITDYNRNEQLQTGFCETVKKALQNFPR